MVLLNAGNPGTWTGPGNTTYLFTGAVPTIIDAGVGHADHLEAIAGALHGRPLQRVLLTHGHPDHASGVPALEARWPGLEVLRWQAPWNDGDRVTVGDLDLEVVHTPGHAADHVCFWNPASRELFCGDMMTATTTILVPPASRGGSLRAYLDSLRRLAALEPVVAWPAHGPAIEQPVERIEEYLRHRAERRAQVEACLADGLTTPDAIVARVYAETPQALWPAARLTVEALLEMLAEERA
jgi:glyoxylase-like metal-dependent hydrolase (beta-lactamase superfamily II)